MGAWIPLIVTVTPFNLSGSGKTPEGADIGPGARFVPSRVRNSPGDNCAVNGDELAALMKPCGFRYTEEALDDPPQSVGVAQKGPCSATFNEREPATGLYP